MWEFIKQLTDPQSIIQYGGLWLLLFVIFAETGLLIGFFLPGDNLILLAGILCKSKPELLNVNYFVLGMLLTVAAITGNMFGYWFGKKTGEKLYQRENSLLFKKKHLEATNYYYKKFGGNATLIMARFLPIVRTFAPIIAGVIKIDFLQFMFYNALGAFLWILSLTGIGYFLVVFFPQITDYMGYIFITLIILTALPVIRLMLKKKETNQSPAANSKSNTNTSL